MKIAATQSSGVGDGLFVQADEELPDYESCDFDELPDDGM